MSYTEPVYWPTQRQVGCSKPRHTEVEVMEKLVRGRKRPYPPAPDYPKDLFAGTAWYYARYRVPYPQRLIDDLRRRACVTGSGRLLDLASGPGRVALLLAESFSEVWAVDQEPEMIEVGREEAMRKGLTNVQWVLGRAEEVKVSARSLELITIGEAFHRLDRTMVAERAMEWLAPSCSLAILGCFSILKGSEPWQRILRKVVRKWRPHSSESRSDSAECSRRSSTAKHDWEVLQPFGFENAGTYNFQYPYVWNLDSILGNLYSTSTLSRRILGGESRRFESVLRRALLAYDSRGVYKENLLFGYSLYKKPENTP